MRSLRRTTWSSEPTLRCALYHQLVGKVKYELPMGCSSSPAVLLRPDQSYRFNRFLTGSIVARTNDSPLSSTNLSSKSPAVHIHGQNCRLCKNHSARTLSEGGGILPQLRSWVRDGIRSGTRTTGRGEFCIGDSGEFYIGVDTTFLKAIQSPHFVPNMLGETPTERMRCFYAGLWKQG